MLVQEEYMTTKAGVKLIRVYSDEHFYIEQDDTKILYEEAIDPENSGRTYTETDIYIEDEDDEMYVYDDEVDQEEELQEYINNGG